LHKHDAKEQENAMKHLILVAGLTLLAAPAFAGTPKSDSKAATFTGTQTGSGMRDSAIARRHDTLRRNAAARSDNARAAWRGSVHYY
jgi:hypothetical protein